MPCQRCEELERQLRIARAELAEARHWNEEWRALAALREPQETITQTRGALQDDGTALDSEALIRGGAE